MSHQLKQDRERRPEHRTLWFGTIAEDVANDSEMAFVILPEFSEKLKWGPCRWMPRTEMTGIGPGTAAAVVKPLKGDECIVAFDNRRQPWILAWWPF